MCQRTSVMYHWYLINISNSRVSLKFLYYVSAAIYWQSGNKARHQRYITLEAILYKNDKSVFAGYSVAYIMVNYAEHG